MQKSTSKKNTKRVAIVGGTVAALLGGGIAFAAWTSTGTGSGSAVADYANADLGVTVTTVNGLYPTGSFNVPFTVANTNPYNVTLTKVTLEGVTSDKTGCASSVVADTPSANPANTLIDTDQIAKTTGVTPSANFPIKMLNTADDTCKGATFTVTLKAWGASS